MNRNYSIESLIKAMIVGVVLTTCVFSKTLAGSEKDTTYTPDDYNIVWNTQSKNAAESMPCGGGDIGLNVWVENGDVLFYMQRSGSLAETNEYLKLGRVRLRLDPNPFGTGQAVFRQELKLREGSILLEGQSKDENGKPIKAKMNVWVEVKRPVIHVEIESESKIQVTASYENWRFEDEMIPNNDRRRSFFSLDKYPGEVKLTRDHVAHTAAGVLFYHRNPGENGLTEMLIKQQGLEAFRDEIPDDLLHRTFGGLMTGEGFVPAGVSEGTYQVRAFKAWNLQSEKPAERHHLRIITHIDQTPTLEKWQQDLQDIVETSSDDPDQARRETLDWWHQFWNRSWIAIQPLNPDSKSNAWRIGRNYQLFRYMLGTNAYGEYPTKFNGGNFTFDANLVKGGGNFPYGPDSRNWGGGIFTAQNQRLSHWPMLKAGDFDAMLPQFELYRKALPGAKARVKAHFNHEGAAYCEYIGVPGIAAGFGWGWESGPRVRGEEIPFGDPRANASRRYGDVVEKGVEANHAISYHWESQLEHAYMILEYLRFTGADISPYIPFIENAVIFFDEHYRKRQKMRNGEDLDENGKLVIFPSTSCESYRGAENPSDIIAGLHACVEGILALEDSQLKLRNKDYYRALLQTIPPYTYAEVKGDRIFQPAKSWLRYQNMETPQFYPLFPFNRFNLLTSNRDHLEIFRNTWKHGDFKKNIFHTWRQDGIIFARMGLRDDAAQYNLKKLDDSSYRFPTFWGPGPNWVPDHDQGGSGMIGLQEMLMQTIHDKILLFPGWPKGWDVDFKLHAPNNTTVEAGLKNGKVDFLKVTPETRTQDVTVLLD